MSNVTIGIAGRRFTVACGEGEEAHIARLGQIVHEKIHDMPGLSSQSEARCLLYAALLLADENVELKDRGSKAAAAQPDVAGPLENLADRLEHLASWLENGAG